MENAQTEPTPTAIETLTSGADLVVKYQDGTTETVRCRIRKVSEISTGFLYVADEAKMTDWLFDKPLGWSDGLSMKSYNDAVELALRVNADFFDALTRRGQRGAVLLKTLNPTEYERLFGGGVQSGQSSTSYRKPR